MIVLISNNSISQIKSNGIHLQSQDNTVDVNQATFELSATVTGNTADGQKRRIRRWRPARRR